jgi:hypothetical protein
VRRFEKIVRLATIGPVKAGWLVKSKGRWILTEDGKKCARDLQGSGGLPAKSSGAVPQVTDVLIQQPSQVSPVQHNHMIQEFATHTSDPTLGDAVCHGLRNPVRTGWLPIAFTLETTSELNFESRSKSRNRCGSSPSSQVSRNCTATQNACGFEVKFGRILSNR